MKLTDIELTTLQARALLRLLDREVEMEERRIAQDEHERETAEFFNRCYEKVCDLARQTARVNGAIEGLSAAYAATATWEAFIASEGWFSPFDVDEHWNDRDDPEFEEGWVLAYVEEIRQSKKAL